MAKKKATKKTATKKTAVKKATKKPAKTKEMLLVGSKTKEALKGSGFNVSSDTMDALNEHVYWLVDQAQKRCAANGRKTIRPYDILA
jgi:histone H3/H4